jgi:hypothetical protein
MASLENGVMETKGTFRISLRNLLVIIGFVLSIASVLYGQQASIASQSAKIEQIAVVQTAQLQTIQTDVQAIKIQIGAIALSQQATEIKVALLQLQVRQLEEKK